MATTIDRRRFLGPENTKPLTLQVSEAEKLANSRFTVDGQLKRTEDRRAEDVRPLFIQTGLISQADGSAYVETRKTKIVCAVYGPRPLGRNAPFNPNAKLNVEVKLAPFSCPDRRRTPGKDCESATLARALQQSLLPSLRLELLPKSQIDILMTILEMDNPVDEISTGVVCASVALAAAGIEMYGLVIGCSAAFYKSPSLPSYILDPDYEESLISTGLLTFSCIPALGTVTNIWQRGRVNRKVLTDALDVCLKTCGEIHKVAAKALLEGNKAQEGSKGIETSWTN
ncbi:ribosomal protein S5 domain 2-like protein [Atractiella rhizophila]|nr:ribosomal protein S5 domain 2-like protein [Atractiella rhizophila]